MPSDPASGFGSTAPDASVARESNEVPSNQKLLCTAFVSFMSFAVAQTIAAFIAGSEAMMGDSAAMIVDALTYLFNWYAERKKKGYEDELKQNPTGNSALEYRRYTYQLELIPPLLSVFTLLVVTGFVLNKAIRVLILDAKRDVSEQEEPNIHLMMLFSCLNLLLDLLNVFCFAKARHALGYETTSNEPSDQQYVTTMRSLLNHEESDLGTLVVNGNQKNRPSTHDGTNMEPMEIEADRPEDGEESNLNMCSAYTHVFADTLRSIAVIVASALATVITAITAEEADAVAAVVVSILIILSLFPLFRGLMQTSRALRRVDILLQEEDFETEFLEDTDIEQNGTWL